jgi:type I restriction enzyme S subunit
MDFLLYQARMTGSVGQQRVPSEFLEEVELPIPSLEIQKKIVARIEQLLSKINQAKKLKEETKKDIEEIMQAALHQMFKRLMNRKTPMKKLEQVCILITDGTHKTPRYVEKGIPFLSVKNIRETGFLLDNVKYIAPTEHHQLSENCKPKKGDVLYTKIGTTGIAKVVDIDLEFSIFVSVALLRPDISIIDPFYLETILNSPMARDQAHKLTRGAANRNLVLKDVKRIEIPIATYEEQKRIIDRTNLLQKEIAQLSQYQTQVEDEIELMAQAILKAAFSGRL